MYSIFQGCLHYHNRKVWISATETNKVSALNLRLSSGIWMSSPNNTHKTLNIFWYSFLKLPRNMIRYYNPNKLSHTLMKNLNYLVSIYLFSGKECTRKVPRSPGISTLEYKISFASSGDVCHYRSILDPPSRT